MEKYFHLNSSLVHSLHNVLKKKQTNDLEGGYFHGMGVSFFLLFCLYHILGMAYFATLLYWWLVWGKRVLPSPVMHSNCSDLSVYFEPNSPWRAQSADINHCGGEAAKQGVKHFPLDGTFLTGTKLRKCPAISSQRWRHTQTHRQKFHRDSFSQDSAHNFLRLFGWFNALGICMSGIEWAGWPQCSFIILQHGQLVFHL